MPPLLRWVQSIVLRSFAVKSAIQAGLRWPFISEWMNEWMKLSKPCAVIPYNATTDTNILYTRHYQIKTNLHSTFILCNTTTSANIVCTRHIKIKINLTRHNINTNTQYTAYCLWCCHRDNVIATFYLVYLTNVEHCETTGHA